MKKRKILFVGSFKTGKDGGWGGQLFACKTIVNSDLKHSVDWTLLDTTHDSNISSSKYRRIQKSVFRMIKFIYFTIFYKFDFFLIFVSDGWSFWEKGFMSILVKYFSNAKVVLAPRSGFIINDLNNKTKLSRFIKFVLQKSDFVVCQSNSWKLLFEKTSTQKNDKKYLVIENMIDYEKYAQLPLKNTYDNQIITILFLSWVTKSKGIYELIDAAKLLKKDGFDFKIIIGGKGEDFASVENEILTSNMSNYVSLEGWIVGDEKLKVLKESDIYVLPTYFEGYPNSLMEAMASSKACIGTRVGSIPDMIDHKINGLLIEKENHHELYLALKYLITHPIERVEMAQNAKVSIRNTNSIPIVISKFEKIFKQD